MGAVSRGVTVRFHQKNTGFQLADFQSNRLFSSIFLIRKKKVISSPSAEGICR